MIGAYKLTIQTISHDADTLKPLHTNFGWYKTSKKIDLDKLLLMPILVCYKTSNIIDLDKLPLSHPFVPT